MREGRGWYELSSAGERVVGKNNYCLKFKLKKEKKKTTWRLTQVSTDKGSNITQMIG